MKEHLSLSEKKLKRYLTLSLIVHVLLALIIFFPPYLRWIISPESNKSMPASLKPKKSDFGTYVFYDLAPKEIPHHLPKPSDIQPEPPPEEKLIKTDKDLSEKEKPVKLTEQKPTPKLIKPIIMNDTHENIRIKETLQNTYEKEHEKKVEEKKEILENLEERIKEIEKKQKQRTKMQLLKKSPIPKKKKRNIIAMTRGYIQNLKNTGNDFLERKGDDNKVPSFKELKYLSYEQRVSWQLQASWKRLFTHQAKVHPLFGKAIISFIIDKNGKLNKLDLIQSSGHEQLDEQILESARKAAPFPPIPKHFETNTYSTGRIIHVHAQSFFF